MKIIYRKRNAITSRAIPTWLDIVDDYKKGIPVKEIAKNHINPNTGRPYTVAYIFWVLKRVQKL